MPATLADIQAKYGDSVYPLYKDEMHEPYMENDNGIGYQGVVMYDELEDKVQCQECGKWIGGIANHSKLHNLTVDEYKEKFSLPRRIPLCSKKKSNACRINGTKNLKGWAFKKGHIPNIPKKDIKRAIKRSVMTHNSIFGKNKYGLCDAQIAARLVIVRDMAKRESLEKVSCKDLRMFDKPLLVSMKSRYGNYKLASKALGLNNIGNRKYEDSVLLAQLREFVVKNKKMPVATDFKNLATFVRYFGSWRRARIMAGLNQLLEEVKNK